MTANNRPHATKLAEACAENLSPEERAAKFWLQCYNSLYIEKWRRDDLIAVIRAAEAGARRRGIQEAIELLRAESELQDTIAARSRVPHDDIAARAKSDILCIMISLLNDKINAARPAGGDVSRG